MFREHGRAISVRWKHLSWLTDFNKYGLIAKMIVQVILSAMLVCASSSSAQVAYKTLESPYQYSDYYDQRQNDKFLYRHPEVSTYLVLSMTQNVEMYI